MVGTQSYIATGLLLLNGVLAQEQEAVTETPSTGDSWLTTFALKYLVAKPLSAEWAELPLKQRILTYDWSKEAFVLACLGVYVLTFYVLKSINRKKVEKWVAAMQPNLNAQFAQVGPRMNFLPEGEMLVEDSPSQFSTYCSGRINIDSLVAKFELVRRQNFLAVLTEYVVSFFFSGYPAPDDLVEILLTPTTEREGVKAASIDPAIFAIVNKEEMNRAREDNFFLSITRTSESDKLPFEFVFMSEASEIIDSLYTQELAEAVKGSENVLLSFALTDQSAVRPETVQQVQSMPIVVLRLRVSTKSDDLEKTKQILVAAINFVDTAVAKAHWRPEVMRKIKKTREDEVKRIEREASERAAEEAREKKAEALREAKRSNPNIDVRKKDRSSKKNRPKMMR